MASHVWRKPKNQQAGEVIVSTGGMAVHGVVIDINDKNLTVKTAGGSVLIDLARIKLVLPKRVAA